MMRAWPVVILAVMLSSCGYALAGRANTLPDYIKRIGVPTFQNLSMTPDLDRVFTEAVRVELQSRGRYQVVPDATGVDAVLSASIRSVTSAATVFTANGQASKYTITVISSAEFKETKADKAFWSSPSLRVIDEYEVAAGVSVTDLATLFAQDRNALDRLAKTFAHTLVGQILEAF